jgi:nicotinamidase-related amidase
LAGRPYPWLEAVAPRPEDWVVYKQRPSAFFGTPLASHLVDLGVDTLVIGGQTTSGCVRATVIDAFSYGFRTIVVEECTYDRCMPSHKINLFDMHQKYADVLPIADVLASIDALTTLPAGQ